MTEKCPKCGYVHQTVGYRNCVINLREDSKGWYTLIMFASGHEVRFYVPHGTIDKAIEEAKRFIDKQRGPPLRSRTNPC